MQAGHVGFSFLHQNECVGVEYIFSSKRGCCAAQAWELIGTVLPFHAVTFRSGGGGPRPSRAVLDVLDKCAHRLLYELKMEGLATGLDVHVEVCLTAFSLYLSVAKFDMLPHSSSSSSGQQA